MINEDRHKSKQNRLAYLAWALNGLTIYHKLNSDHLMQKLHNLLAEMESTNHNLQSLYRKYHEFCALAIEYNWPSHLIDLILMDDNHFSRTANTYGYEGLSTELKLLVNKDLEILSEIIQLNSRDIIKAIKEIWHNPGNKSLLLTFSPDQWAGWENAYFLIKEEQHSTLEENESKGHGWADNHYNKIKTYFLGHKKYEADQIPGLELLARYYREVGRGILGRDIAFLWQKSSGGDYLKGIPYPDQVCDEHLIGLERELQLLFDNTERLLNGIAAHHVLLYGSRGTGKSSAVKSLLTRYAHRGLRLIEVGKEDLGDFPDIVSQLAAYSQKFIIFIDDLSFESMEAEYKALKVALEGHLATPGSNMLIYATTNRRHLIRETFTDRQGEEVHVQDNQNEKLSLADRFGLTITFPSTDQQRYLKIVEGLASQRGLIIDDTELRHMALRWELMHNGCSGRTAKQFIDHLIGEKK